MSSTARANLVNLHLFEITSGLRSAVLKMTLMAAFLNSEASGSSTNAIQIRVSSGRVLNGSSRRLKSYSARQDAIGERLRRCAWRHI